MNSLREVELNENRVSFAFTTWNISNTRDDVWSGYPNTEKRVENKTENGVLMTEFR